MAKLLAFVEMTFNMRSDKTCFHNHYDRYRHLYKISSESYYHSINH